jgi:hypothetical protein
MGNFPFLEGLLLFMLMKMTWEKEVMMIHLLPDMLVNGLIVR